MLDPGSWGPGYTGILRGNECARISCVSKPEVASKATAAEPAPPVERCSFRLQKSDRFAGACVEGTPINDADAGTGQSMVGVSRSGYMYASYSWRVELIPGSHCDNVFPQPSAT